MKNEINIFSRHTIRADGEMGRGGLEADDSPSERFPAVTRKGEEKAREVARNQYTEIIDGMEENGILFLGGSSEEDRTRQTAEIIGDELLELYKGQEDILILDKDGIEKIREEAIKEDGKALDKIEEIIRSNQDRKVVLCYPMFLKNFSLRPGFRDAETGEHTEFSKQIFNKVGYDGQNGAIEWFGNKGKIDAGGDIISGPVPEEISQQHIEGIERLRKFAEKFSHSRQINIGFTGHGWNLDALALYYASGGDVDKKIFKDLFDEQVIEQTETGWVEVKNGKAILHYKGKEFGKE